MTPLNPAKIAPPFGDYSHGIATGKFSELVVTSGQLGLAPDGSLAGDVTGQARQCFENIDAILADANLGRDSIIRLNAYVTRREDFAPYMSVRDEFLADVVVKPASTLLIVSGFTKEEFLVEIEATAIRSL